MSGMPHGSSMVVAWSFRQAAPVVWPRQSGRDWRMSARTASEPAGNESSESSASTGWLMRPSDCYVPALMPPRSIVHVITGLETGGAEMMLLKLLSVSDRERWRPSVVSLRDRGTLGARIERLGIPVTAVGMRGPVPAPRTVWRLLHEVRGLSPTLVQGWMYHGNL